MIFLPNVMSFGLMAVVISTQLTILMMSFQEAISQSAEIPVYISNTVYSSGHVYKECNDYYIKTELRLHQQ